MMKLQNFIAYQNDTGEITHSGSVPENSYYLVEADPGTTLVETKESVDLGTYYWDGKLIELPENPNPNYEFNYITKVWEDPKSEQDHLDAERRAMFCSPAQGILAIGETIWAQVEALADEPETPFTMKISILKTVEWRRNSQMMDELAWIVDLSDEEVDDLFRIAMQIMV